MGTRPGSFAVEILASAEMFGVSGDVILFTRQSAS